MLEIRKAYPTDAYTLINIHDITWKNAEVINQKNGKPQINWVSVSFPQIESMDISISHCKKYASANVTILYKEK